MISPLSLMEYADSRYKAVVLSNQGIQFGCGFRCAKARPGWLKLGANGDSQHHAVVSDGDSGAVQVTVQCSEIGDVALLPKKTMKACVAGGVRVFPQPARDRSRPLA